MYYILFAIWYIISKLPASLHYFNAWWLSAVLFHVVRYRRKMVFRNIRDAYPMMSDEEVHRTVRRFYRHFCDNLVESVMYLGMSEREVRRRMKFVNPEVLHEAMNNGRTIGVFLGHYANWEYVSSFKLWYKNMDCNMLQLYHPLENPVFDRIVGYTRERFGNVNVSVNESLRHIMRYRAGGKSVAIGFIADQVPFWNNIHHWTTFLNHKDTPVFTGPERLMRKLDMEVYYLEIRQVKRGYYEAEFKLITKHPNEHPEFWITEQYNRMLEQTINADPPLWLWSHNRWKRTKEEWLKMYDPETGKIKFE